MTSSSIEIWRAHRGTDYAAPIGTKVLAIADGTVEFMGKRGEFGNLLIIDHYDRFMTHYGHLHGFASGVTPGSRVEKGQPIGLVGMTGLATGPHLHYEFRVSNGGGRWSSIPQPDGLEVPSLTDDAHFRAVRYLQGQLEVAERAHLLILY